MDPFSLRDRSVIGSASSQLAVLDLNGKVSHSMERGFSSVVLDTPDRMAAAGDKDGNASFGEECTSPSLGFSSRDGLSWCHGSRISDHRGNCDISFGSDSSSRRDNWGPLPAKSRKTRDHPIKRGGITEPKCELQENFPIHGQTDIGGKNEEERCRKVIDNRLIMVPGSSRGKSCMNGIADNRKDVKNHTGLNSNPELIHLESAPQYRPVRRARTCAASKVSDHSIEMGKNIAIGQEANLSIDPHSKKVQDEPRTLKLDNFSKISGSKMSTRDAFVSPCTTAVKGAISSTQVGEGALLINRKIADKGKIIELSPDSLPNHKGSLPSSSGIDSLSRVTIQRKLVRNGCISPANIVKNKGILDEVQDEVKNISVKKSLVNSSRQMGSSTFRVESHCPGKSMGKGILDAHPLNGAESKTRSSRSRLPTRLVRDAAVAGDTDISFFVESDWISTRNRRETSKGVATIKDNTKDGERALISDEIICQHSHEPISNAVQAASVRSMDAQNSRCEGSERLMKGKRKNRSGRMFLRETSVAGTSGPSLPLVAQPTNVLSTRSNNGQGFNVLLPSVIDVDELSSPETRHISGNSSISNVLTERALQVESDELLARQLQEQFFNESPGSVNYEEIDANEAWRLQQEVDDRRMSSTQRHQSQSRDPFAAHLYRRNPRHHSRNPSGQLARQPRTIPRISQLRRSLNGYRMDLESRLNYLEALEATFDIGNATDLPHNLLHLRRDFNENDYEMLLSLDNGNHNHAGAQHHQIDCLPVSVVQTQNPDETCAVCLDAPSVGDTIRHLPCLHKFHKECIDTWLRRKPLCPVCKSEIS